MGIQTKKFHFWPPGCPQDPQTQNIPKFENLYFKKKYSRVPNKQGGVIKEEGGESLKKNKRRGPNKRGGWQISEN